MNTDIGGFRSKKRPSENLQRRQNEHRFSAIFYAVGSVFSNAAGGKVSMALRVWPTLLPFSWLPPYNQRFGGAMKAVRVAQGPDRQS